MFNVKKLRQDFPILSRRIKGKQIVYLDSAATSLKPQVVIDKVNEYYGKYSANVYRGIYSISEKATAEYEKAREKVSDFIGAKNPSEVIFTRGTTESINLVAQSWGRKYLSKGDQIVVTILEHHSNFVPWQQLAKEKGVGLPAGEAGFRVWGIGKDGKFNLGDLDTLITRSTKLLTITTVSNVLGTINPIKEIVKKVRHLSPHCLIVIDAAQAVPHMKIDVGNWGADFVAFSGHKMLGPTGVGVLWGKHELLDAMDPYQFGGEMISEVHIKKTLFKDPPLKFEAGTPHIAGVIGLGTAVDYLTNLGMENVRKHEEEITKYALSRLSDLRYLKILGPKQVRDRGGVIAFTMEGVHAHDIAQILDEDNICVRAGHHCAMPLHDSLKLSASVRASFYIYTTKDDIDKLIVGLKKVKKVFS